METIDTVGDYRAQWGEAPIWWNKQLIYVDIESHRVLSYNPTSGKETSIDVSATVGRVGTVVPRASGGLVIAGDTGIHFLDPETGTTTSVANPEPDKPDNRFNDGKCSPDGRFFAGTISLTKNTGDAALYRLDPDLSLHTAFPGVTNSNGIVWSADASTCYYIDTPRHEVIAFDYSTETGLLTNARTAVSTSHIDASPDGMTIDSDDNLWIAFCHGACVACFNPISGNEIRRVDLPCLETTACTFGGKNLDELYVTTGIHKTETEEHAGRLLRIRGLGVTGIPAYTYCQGDAFSSLETC